MAGKEKQYFQNKIRVNPGATAPSNREPGMLSELFEPTAKPVNKGGRPKGIPKTKKTFYLATDLNRLEQTQINIARYAAIRVRDESDTVDLALELLDHMAAQPEYASLINSIYKSRLNQ